jgi:predicted amidohydrolase/ribosomal protein S18 acetylase RimI-like enzyme
MDPKNFEKKISIRHLKIEDYEKLVELQKLCFPGMKTWSKEQIQSQLSIFPEGQICIEYNSKLVASSSSLIVNFDLYSETHTWYEISDHGFIRNHNPEGDTLYGIEMMVHPKYRGMKLARRLYDARKQLAVQKNIMRIILGGRIPGYLKHSKKMTAREYVDKVINKTFYDPVLTPQLSNGFVLKRLITDYLIPDEDSKGYATFLEWTNIDYNPDKKPNLSYRFPVRICAVQYMMRTITGFDEFARQVEYFVDVASDYKCDFVLFPEMITTQLLSFLPSSRPGLAVRQLHEFTDQYIQLFSGLSVKYNINIIGGSHFIIEHDDLFNVSFLFKRDGGIDKQYKLHITPSEKHWWGIKAGNKVNIMNTDKGKIAILICYDIEFPELARIAVEKGVQIIFVPFCTDERSAYLRVRYCAQARCIENPIYIALSGSVGNLPFVENVDIHYAQSAILTPSDFAFARDAVRAEATPNVEMVIIEDVDLELLNKHKSSGSVLTWADRRQDLYQIKYEDKEQN